MISLVVTIGASATPATTLDLYASVMILKASGTDYMGGANVDSSHGVPVPSATPMVVSCARPKGISLKNTYFSGSQGDTVIIVYESAE